VKRLSHEDMWKILNAAVVISSQKTVAKNLGVSPQYLSDVLKKRRPIAGKLLKAMGYEQVTYFIETN